MKTSELTGAALDWAVAKCETWIVGTTDDDLVSFVIEDSVEEMHFWPSTDWAQGGPIIEREKIKIAVNVSDTWTATIKEKIDDGTLSGFYKHHHGVGPTPLIAAMRCYVAIKLGNDIKIPMDLLK